MQICKKEKNVNDLAFHLKKKCLYAHPYSAFYSEYFSLKQGVLISTGS